jgi:hypothetical protein
MCEGTADAIGANIPGGSGKREEYLASHPELEVILLTSEEIAAYEREPLVLP